MIDWNLIGVGTTLVAAVWGLAWWLSGQFSTIRSLVFSQGEKILDKLEYHERHDDERFSEIKNDIWEIRVQNAAKGGVLNIPIKRKEIIENI